MMEIYTALNSCRTYGEGARIGAERIWDIVLAHRLTRDEPPLYGLANDDCHAYHPLPWGAELETHGAHSVTRFIGTRRGVDLTATPVLDEHGTPLNTTAAHSPAIGAVLHEVAGNSASYTFHGDELYVRAVVQSDQPHPLPTRPGEVTQAWTQPVMPA